MAGTHTYPQAPHCLKPFKIMLSHPAGLACVGTVLKFLGDVSLFSPPFLPSFLPSFNCELMLSLPSAPISAVQIFQLPFKAIKYLCDLIPY